MTYSILVIDDEDAVRKNIVSFFEDEEFIVQEAKTAEEGLDLLKNKTYDIAIVDMRLPGMDGNSFILNAQQYASKMQFIIHTGSTSYTLPRELMDLGISGDQVFLKPLTDMQVMLDAINKHLPGIIN